MLLAVTVYFPRYNQGDTASVISWDVSGYYYYLPATFIYHDLRYLKFEKEIIIKYHPSNDYYQGTLQPNDSVRVFQYTCGMALLYSPYFFLANFIAAPLGYQADGFSPPYQFAIGIGSLIYSFVGLFFLRKLLLRYFSDTATAITLTAIAIGSNYFNYASIDAPMSHSNLFTIYVLIMFFSIKFWEKPSLHLAFLVGLFAGLATIIRPTEIISFIIPALIGIKSGKDFWERIKFLAQKFYLMLIVIIPVLGFGFLQMCYWKYVTGNWIVYSYQDQGFNWIHPHLGNGLISYRAGWLIYTPIMIFSLVGFYFLYIKKKEFFWFSFLFTVLFIYICFAWNIWYYSGSYGIRAMVQSYAVLAIPFTAFNEWMLARKWKLILFSSIMLFFTYYNLWLTHQAHNGGLLNCFGMTKEYFWKIFLRYNVPIEDTYFLDCRERFDGTPKNSKQLFTDEFENDSLNSNENIPVINGSHSLFIDKQNTYFGNWRLALPNAKYDWLRVSFICRLKSKEYNDWNMTKIYVNLFSEGKEIKSNALCLQHVMIENETKRIHLDVKLPPQKCDSVQLFFFKGNSWAPVGIYDLKLEVFNQ